MPRANSIAVIGLQWGDEGKGKIVDFLSETVDAVARFGGGANAGHTIVVGDRKFILRLIPSGILHQGKICLIGSGVACDPEVLRSEIAELEKCGISIEGRLFVDFATHLVLPLHKARDGFEDERRGRAALDTTRRGIGPSYADRASRMGIRVGDLFDHSSLPLKLKALVSIHKRCLDGAGVKAVTDENQLMQRLFEFEPLFKPLIADIGPMIMKMLSSGKKVLFEGAQGSLLDIDFGTYPYSTSSHPTIGGVLIGLGVPPSYLGVTVGVFKAYMTRVGNGPFPTEIKGELGEVLRQRGTEFGSVTRRARRTGWLDMVALRRMIELNGVDKLAITKLDVLDGIKEILVCESYELRGRQANSVPPNHPDFGRAKPVYAKLEGWDRPVKGKRKISQLPAQARRFLDFVEESAKIPIWLVSTGCSREDTIVLNG